MDMGNGRGRKLFVFGFYAGDAMNIVDKLTLQLNCCKY